MKAGHPCKYILASLVVLTACDLSPPYTPPSAPLAANFKEQAGNWHAATGDQKVSDVDWWHVFNDTALNNYEDEAIKNNQNLQQALARYDEAHAEFTAAAAQLLPQVNANASAMREKDSQTTASALGESALAKNVGQLDHATGVPPLSSSPAQYNDFRMGVEASYDPDIFGRLRSAAASAKDQAQASAEDLAAMRLAIEAQVAEGYFMVRVDDAQDDILAQSLQAYQKQLDLTLKLHAEGMVDEQDVDQAKVTLDNALAQLQDAQLKRSQMEHALAVLLGESPSSFSLPLGKFNPVATAVDPGLPSQLLERRPDIAAAERRVAAANEEIGVARAAWFPDFSLTAEAGFESAVLSKLISAPSLFWSVGPQVTQTIFDGGAIEARVQEAKAAKAEAVASYRQSVLSATQDVEDNLAGLRQYALETVSRKQAVIDSQRSLDRANILYREGIDSYLDVVTQQNGNLQAELAFAQVQMSDVSSYIHLINSLGGKI